VTLRLIARGDADAAAIELLAGGVVAVPTDTVYGVAASLDHPDAVARLFALKRRPQTTALPVMVAGIGELERVGARLSGDGERLAAAFWPGPLTLVLDADAALAEMVGARDATIGVRIPDDDDLLAVITRCGPLAVTSANEHGAEPCHDAAEVLAAFTGRDELSAVLDGGRRAGQVSTVVDAAHGELRVIRVGSISEDEIVAACSPMDQS
jgi:tRNA threonylcarbamoyl adenosine modification protein (Sua5/YciO/YrdC/YwlC family)